MRSFLLNKLVRDKVFTSMQELGQQITHRRLSDKEFLQELQKKLVEEAKEINLEDAKVAEELADLLEVIETAARELGIKPGSLRKIQDERRQKRGGFEERIYVERLDLDDDDPWVEYYANEPGRFKEV